MVAETLPTVARVAQRPEPDPSGEDAGDDDTCRALPPLEHWLVIESGATVTSQLLFHISRSAGACPGDPAAESVEIRANGFTCTDAGGAVSAPTRSLNLRLSPLTWSRASGERRYDGAADLSVWDWEGFSGQIHMYLSPDGDPMGEAELLELDLENSPRATHVAPLLTLDLPAKYLAGAWRTSGLGRCALRVDGHEGRGVTLTGRADATDAELRVVTTRR